MLAGGTMSDDPRYPIGKFSFDGTLTDAQKREHLDNVEQTPARMRAAVQGLSDTQINTPYRDGGWTVRQVVHHVPDSHMNAYIRFKLALTEEEPTIRPYMEDRWGELSDAKSAPIELSLALLDTLHKRWMLVLRAIQPGDWKRSFRHPEMGLMNLEKTLALYSWHGRHHVAHVTELRKTMGW
jgi:DinB superfamily